MFRLAQAIGAFLLLASLAGGQELAVYSDLVPLAEKEGADLGCEPLPEAQSLEVLSPALPLGGRLTLLVVAKAKAGSGFVLDVGLNPEGRTALKLYRYFPGLRYANHFFAHPVEEVNLPFRGRIAEGQRCAIFFLEVRAKSPGPLERVKVEPALWMDNGSSSPSQLSAWSRYPLEVRLSASKSNQDVGWHACEAPLRTIAWALLSASSRNCAPRSLSCLPTEEPSVGSLLTSQLMSDFPTAPAAPACPDPGPESDLLRNLLRGRARSSP